MLAITPACPDYPHEHKDGFCKECQMAFWYKGDIPLGYTVFNETTARKNPDLAQAVACADCKL